MKLLQSYNQFLGPPECLFEEHEKSLEIAKQVFRESLVKMSLDISHAKGEIAYGHLSSKNLSLLYEQGRKVASPLIGVGTFAHIAGKQRPGGENDLCKPMNVSDKDIVEALAVLEGQCGQLNELCQEGIGLIIRSIGRHRVTPFKKPDNGNGISGFIPRFDSAVEALWNKRTLELSRFHNETRKTPSHALFIVVFVQFLMFAVAKEVRLMTVFVDNLEHTMTRRRIMFPKLDLRALIHNRAAKPPKFSGRTKRMPVANH